MKVVRNKNNYFIKVKKKNTLYGTPNGKDNKN